MDAKHISLTQIHAAQLELLQEDAEVLAHCQEPRNHAEHMGECV